LSEFVVAYAHIVFCFEVVVMLHLTLLFFYVLGGLGAGVIAAIVIGKYSVRDI